MKRTVILLMIATSLSALAAQETQTQTPTPSGELTEARKAIDKGNAQWIEAWDKADASLIAGLFATDGVLLGKNGKSFKGPNQILERMKTVMGAAGKGVKATVTTVDLWLDGDQLTDRLDRVSIMAKHLVKAESFRAGRLAPEREGIFLAGHSSRRQIAD